MGCWFKVKAGPCFNPQAYLSMPRIRNEDPSQWLEPFDIVKMASNGRALTLKVIHFNTASKVVKIAQSLDRGSALFGL